MNFYEMMSCKKKHMHASRLYRQVKADSQIIKAFTCQTINLSKKYTKYAI